ncbi:MAG: hypothetical protein L6R37_001311 [Teloschistes peruensis]|nr:MAG: hypothetical protein L6R37_001311 [Teloschistes peruensis]
MPRTTFPPTPAPSTDIVGKDSVNELLCKEKTSFALPPPAIAPAPSRNRPLEEERPQDGSAGSDFSLPPPPTRSRKIIQMTPKTSQAPEHVNSPTEATPARARQTGARGAPAARKTTTKKQSNTTSQAGKRTARKTAHSVIERRRRSKMNEEFGVLKNMIPACKDQDMHKLAILQASIEYLRYLEQCVTDLKAATNLKTIPLNVQHFTPTEHQTNEEQEDEDEDEDEEDSDVEMTGRELLPLQTARQEQESPFTTPLSTTASPAIGFLVGQKPVCHVSSLSGLPSPALGSQTSTGPDYARPYAHSASTSPTLAGNVSKEADEEATAALLMLKKDRRNTNTSSSSSSGRGMSVKDLLSS